MSRHAIAVVGAGPEDRPRTPGRVAARVRKTVLYCEDVLTESGAGPAPLSVRTSSQ